jgi:hypothetical protein
MTDLGGREDEREGEEECEGQIQALHLKQESNRTGHFYH